MAQYKIGPRGFFDGQSLHEAGEIVEMDPSVAPSGSIRVGVGAERLAGGAKRAGEAGLGVAPVSPPAETLIPAPHRAHEVGGAIPTDPKEPALPIEPTLDANKTIEQLAEDEGTPDETTHNKPGSDKATSTDGSKAGKKSVNI